jgi:NADH dehydrogenase (ubiquinone) flavoprotein 2
VSFFGHDKATHLSCVVVRLLTKRVKSDAKRLFLPASRDPERHDKLWSVDAVQPAVPCRTMLGRVLGSALRANGAHLPSAVSVGSLSSCGLRGFATNSHDIFNTHQETADNNAKVEFDFTPENHARAQEIISRYPPNYKQSAVIPLLDLAQQQNKGWLPLVALNRIASLLEMPNIRVYEVATFYTMFNRSKMGQYHIMVCGTTPCRLQGSQGIEAALVERLGIHVGETTADGKFTLGEMECMGACVNAPMVAVADYTSGVEGFTYNFYEDLTPADVVAIVDQLAKGEKPKLGSQHRSKAEPAGAIVDGKWVPCSGSSTLNFAAPPGPYCRDLDAAT